MPWFYVIAGGLMDVGWGTALTYSRHFTKPVPSLLTIVFFALGFILFAKSMKVLPVGIAYSVFIGIGAAGMVIVGMLFMGEPRSLTRMFFIVLLIAGILGLRLATRKQEEANAAKTDGDA